MDAIRYLLSMNIGCLKIHWTHMTTNNSTNNNFEFFSAIFEKSNLLKRTIYCWVLSKAVSSTIFKVFCMTWPGIEPKSPRPFANTLTTWQWAGMKIVYNKKYNKSVTLGLCIRETYISSCRLSTPHPIVHHFRQVLRATSRIYPELLYVCSSRSPCFCSTMWRGPQEYITYELVPTSPAVSCMSGSSNFGSFCDVW